MKIVLSGAFMGVLSLAQDDPAVLKKKMAEAQAQYNTAVKVLDGAMISGPTVKGAPYSAQAVNEMVQTLADGNRITNNSSLMLYRDSQGRERREESLSGALRSVFITDPVDGVSYMLEPGSKVARKTPQHAVTVITGARGGGGVGVGVGRGGTITAETRTFSMNAGNGPETFVFSNQEIRSSKANTKVEHLGTQTIEGVSAEGTRTTITIPAGQIGNELPIVTVSERWYSPELQLTVMSTRSDPRTGTTTYKLTNINRAEPSPALFQIPADYTVEDANELRRKFPRPEEQ